MSRAILNFAGALKRCAATIVVVGCAILHFPNALLAAPIIVIGQGVTVTGTATQIGAIWRYEYKIEETASMAAPLVRLAIGEHPTHAGLHHEFNFQNAGGTFARDNAMAVAFGLPGHNYFWDNLAIAARGVITVGFDDVHGPNLAPWGIMRFGAGRVFLGPDDLLPVPAVPEPASLALLGTGLLGLAGLALGRRRAAG